MIDYLFNEKNKKIIFIFLFTSLTLICIPRFDRADYGFIKNFTRNDELYEGLPYDILIYKNYIEYFRGEKTEESIMPPYTYRILVPFLASKLPFAPLTSLNLINLIFLYAGLIAIYLILLKLKAGFKYIIFGCMLYIFSFPVFYYATSGYIDATLIGLLTLGVLFTINGRYLLLMILILAGTLANEKIIILFPFLTICIFKENKDLKKSLILTTLFFVIYVLTTVILRKYTPSSTVSYLWLPEAKYIMQNLFRGRTYLSFLLTFGIPGILATISIFKFSKNKINKYNYFYVGCLTSVMLYLYSIFSAWSDGRTVWTIYPFAIPVSVLLAEEILEGRKLRKIDKE